MTDKKPEELNESDLGKVQGGLGNHEIQDLVVKGKEPGDKNPGKGGKEPTRGGKGSNYQDGSDFF